MTKAQQYSIARLQQAIETIEELVPVERGRSSNQRRKWLEKAHEVLRLHGSKLGVTVPGLSHFYYPEQFLEHSRLVAGHLQQGAAVPSYEPPASIPSGSLAFFCHCAPPLSFCSLLKESRMSDRLIAPDGENVTYQLQFRKCGRHCRTCVESGGHGPYWYAYWRSQAENGRLRSAYIGKEPPPGGGQANGQGMSKEGVSA